MDVQITIRRGTAGPAFREAAEERARRLEKYEPRLLRVELLFDEDGGGTAAEARAVVPGLPPRVARAAASSRRTAMDRVLRKLRRQLREERARLTEHRGARVPPAAPAGAEEPDEPVAGYQRVEASEPSNAARADDDRSSVTE